MHKDGHWEWQRGREQHCPFKRCQNALAMIGLQGRERIRKKSLLQYQWACIPGRRAPVAYLLTGRWEEASKLEVQKEEKKNNILYRE